MAFVAPNGLWLSRKRAGEVVFPDPVSYCPDEGILQSMAAGTLSLASLTSNVVVGGMGNPSTVVVGSNVVDVNADLRLRGVLSTPEANGLLVRNQFLVTAAGASTNDASAGLTDGAGLMIGNHTAYGTDPGLERSIRWRAGIGSSFYSGSDREVGGASNAGCWDVRGGAFRISTQAPSSTSNPVDREISFGMRVNHDDEFEVYKRVLPSECNILPSFVKESIASYRTVLRVGKMAPLASNTGSAIVLNRSVNPW